MSDYLKEGFIDEVKGCLVGRGQENVIESIKVNGVGQTVDENKAVNIPVPTKTSDLDNDSGYITDDQVNSKVTEGVASIVANAPEDFDTLKEMSDWISQHEDSAAAMNSAILKNKEDIGALQTSKADHDDVNIISEDIGELNGNLSDLKISDVAGGKNLFNKNYVYDGYPDNTTGLPNGSTTYGQVTSDEIKVKPNGKYIKNSFNNANFPNSFFDENHNFICREETSSFITVPSNAHYIRVCLSKSAIDTFQFEEGTTPTDYEPYIPSVKMLAEENAQQSTEAMDLKMLGWSVPKECPIQNEVNGNQFIQKVGRVNLGSLTWYYTVNRFYTVLEGGKHTANYNGVDAYCDKYNNAKDKDQSTFDNKEFSIGSNFASNSTCAIVIRDDSYTNESAFKNAMQGVYLYYELATPITMTIDGNEAVTKLKNDLTPILIQKQISESDWSADGNVYRTYVTLTDDIPSNKKVLSLYQERMYKGDEQSWLGGIIVNHNDLGTKLVVFSTTKINCTLGLQVVLI